MVRIKDWPVAERPREKLLLHGPAPLGDSELLALTLRSGSSSPRLSALDLARQLLNHFGSLRTLTNATAVELCAFPGVGAAKAAELLALGELARRLATTPLRPGERFTTSQEVFCHFRVDAGLDQDFPQNPGGWHCRRRAVLGGGCDILLWFLGGV